jgi:hypothetical protein
MKTASILTLIVVFAALAAPAAASTFLPPRDDTGRKFLLLSAYAMIDYQQSCEMFYHRSGYREMNPILGPRPSRAGMMAFGAGGVALAYGAARMLPAGRFRTVLVDSILATERLNIEENRIILRRPSHRYDRIMIVLKFSF